MKHTYYRLSQCHSLVIMELNIFFFNEYIFTSAHNACVGYCNGEYSSIPGYLCTVGPVIIESPGAEKRLSSNALLTVDNPLVVQVKF